MPPNRLARESSPYLRQHQHNPVDWYPWGPEALARAKAEDRPILLSVGYSACHWCHVMERESFEDPATAARMNALFVNIKVDREERPDIDNIYQTAVQILRRSGGWPLTAFLTPDGRPFFAGTYFPPEPRYGMPGFPDLLDQVDRAWREKRGDVERSADAITQGLSRVRETGPEADIGDAEVVAAAATFLLSKVDELHGGFGTAPKFPSPTNLWTLWRHWRRGGAAAADARDAVLLTLVRMADGGIHDQLAGGFHRYSTDEEWLAPHFEKMLYDNAQLASLYLEAWRECAHGAGPRERADGLLRVATDILEYLRRDMRSPDGLYYAATDADSEGVEGRYFVWTPAEVGAALAGEPDGVLLSSAFCRAYDVTATGNWEGHAIPRRLRLWLDVARELGIDVPTLETRLARARTVLLAARARRVPPLRDEKILVSWNALTILAFIDGWRATGRTAWRDDAVHASDSLLARLYADGRLQHSLCGDDVRGPGFLDDHAAFGAALLHVYEATGDTRYRTAATSLAEALDAHFHDGEGGWYQTPDDGEPLVLRPRDTHDSAVPSGTGLAAAFMLRLYAHTQDPRWRTRAEGTLRANAGLLRANPYGSGVLLGVLDSWLGGFEEVVLGGTGPERAAMTAVAYALPGLDRIVLDLDALPPGHPARAGRAADRPTAWVCSGQTCGLPAFGAAELRDRLTSR